MKSVQPTSYSRFLNALDSLDHISPSQKLDCIEEQILDCIYLTSTKGEALSVGDVLLLVQFGSQATLHGRLKKLVAKGYIQLHGDRGDGRRKSVHITTKAERHYQRLSEFLLKSIRP